MKNYLNHLLERTLLITIFCIIVSPISAQTINDNIINLVPFKKGGNVKRVTRQIDTKMVSTYPNYIVEPLNFNEYNVKKELLGDLYFNSNSLYRQNMSYKGSYYGKHSIEIKHKYNLDYWSINLFAVENSYINLLNRRSTTVSFNFQKNKLFIEASLIANRYETNQTTNQFGISGFLKYTFSPYWSMAFWSTMYNHNPYFSMAAMPFVEASSYGGWLRYQNNGYGLKLGARRYFDVFQKQWKTEPIVTPSVKLGRKFVLELPVGPLVQKSMERLLKKKNNNGPIIIPVF